MLLSTLETLKQVSWQQVRMQSDSSSQDSLSAALPLVTQVGPKARVTAYAEPQSGIRQMLD